ncbi:hypothetical protein BC830DRAFT_1152222 [Chytriomyces sp. MP71]|nr:hypothetical protein BC830DRAFT_1152222 [Chytriomyces sp. MP71]
MSDSRQSTLSPSDEEIKATDTEKIVPASPSLLDEKVASRTQREWLLAHGPIVTFAKEQRIKTRELWLSVPRLYRLVVYALVGLLFVVAAGVPLFIRYALPGIISNLFANDATSTGSPVVIHLFQVNNITGRTPYTERVGGMAISVKATIYGISVPLNIPVSIGTTNWTLSLAVPTESATSGYISQTTSFFPFATVNLPSPIHLANNEVQLVEPNLTLSLLTPSAFTALNRTLSPTGAHALWPLGAALTHALCHCLMSGLAGDVPLLQIESTADVHIGPFLLPRVPLRRALDLGDILVRGAKTFPSVTSASSQDAMQAFLVHVSGAGVMPGTGRVQAVVGVQLPRERYATSPVSLVLEDLNVRVNGSGVPLARVVAPRVELEAGSAEMNATVVVTPLGEVLDTAAGLLLQDFAEANVGVDQVSVAVEGGVKVRWLTDVCDAIWLQIPLRVLGGTGASLFSGLAGVSS